MISFVVVEDNLKHTKKVIELINKVMMPNNREYNIREFSDYTKELSDFIKNDDKYKIYVLDFELPSATAIEVAREIRQCDWTSAIIVNSAYPAFAYETFKQRLQILDFVSKQVECDKNLTELFKLCIDRFDIMKPIQIKTGHTDIRILPSKILYFYRKDRKTYVVAENEEYATTMHLAQLHEACKFTFKRTHKSCYVNPDRVYKYNWKDRIITFDNNKTCDYLSFNHYEELTNNERN